MVKLTKEQLEQVKDWHYIMRDGKNNFVLFNSLNEEKTNENSFVLKNKNEKFFSFLRDSEIFNIKSFLKARETIDEELLVLEITDVDKILIDLIGNDDIYIVKEANGDNIYVSSSLNEKGKKLNIEYFSIFFGDKPFLWLESSIKISDLRFLLNTLDEKNFIILEENIIE